MDHELPTGTVTLLFTDIEGSTRLLSELGGEVYDEALAEHRRLLRRAFARRGGVEVDTQGDAFFYAFPSAPEAIAAAREGQQALSVGPIRVRMGLHTGRPHVGREGYVGEDVHLAARIAAAGHGGQVLVSQATRALVDGELADLGEHRVKDFPEPVWIFQLGEERFPPLKTISNTNLPRPASSFVGREREVSEVVELLQDGARLVTLSGPGGSGKTRLAIASAAELVPDFRNGVFWIGLAALRDPALVGETVAQILGAKDGLAEHIGERELLLLLDNFEHVVEAAPELGSLLESCPNLRLLVTSRALLRVRGEVEYPVSPLAQTEAVELFSARSQLQRSDDIAELCRRLDNLPLAVELAAARTSVLTPGQILERLSQRLDLLKGGRDSESRQQTLRATIAWSYELLTEEERRLFARLSVFAGGCPLEAAAEVAEADLDTLQSLVDKSLTRFADGRFWMLETIREFALERLDASGEAEVLRCRHAEYFLRLAEQAEPELKRARQHEWLELLGAEHENLRAALTWAGDSGNYDIELRLVGALGRFWYVQGHVSEGRRCVEAALARTVDQPRAARARALTAASLVAALMADYERQAETSEERYQLFRELGDLEGAAEALADLGRGAFVKGDLDKSYSLFDSARALSEESGDRWATALARMGLTNIALQRGDFELAQAEAEEAVSISREIDVPEWLAHALVNLGHAKQREDSSASAGAYLESLSICREIGARECACTAFDGLAALEAAAGEIRSAVMLLAASQSSRASAGIEMDSQPYEADLHERTNAAARRELAEREFRDVAAAGARLSFEEAIEYALGLGAYEPGNEGKRGKPRARTSRKRKGSAGGN